MRTVISEDGVRLAVYEHSRSKGSNGPTVVCVHGYPDNHTVWDGVVRAMAGHHVVTYDVRGAGASDVPGRREDYRLDRLEADLAAVADDVSPTEPVHVLGHDWGAVQSWHAVTGERMRGRIASFTSVSGPCLDHAGLWMRAQLRPHPRSLAHLGAQLLSSCYIPFFCLPRLPELAWRSGLVMGLITSLQGGDRQRRALSDAINGLELYRANMLPRFRGPAVRTTDVPVQVVVPSRDPFVGTPVQTEITPWVSTLRVRPVRSGHWLPRSHPGLLAHEVTEFVHDVVGGSIP